MHPIHICSWPINRQTGLVGFKTYESHRFSSSTWWLLRHFHGVEGVEGMEGMEAMEVTESVTVSLL